MTKTLALPLLAGERGDGLPSEVIGETEFLWREVLLPDPTTTILVLGPNVSGVEVPSHEHGHCFE